MAYNSFFPMGYQQPYINYNQAPQNPPMAQNGAQNTMQNGIIWVQGIEGAKAYPVGAGQNALLMDSEESVFYIKSTDQSGMPMPLRAFSYSEIGQQKAETVDMSGYVTRDELEERLKELTPKKATKKKEVKEDE